MTLDRNGRCGWARLACAVLVLLIIGAPPARAGYTVVDLGGLPGGSAALSISTDGTVAGYELVGQFMPHATLFENGQPIDLGTLGGDASIALGSGIGGRAVGWARLPDRSRHAFLYEGGTMRDLGTLGGLHSQAFAINSAGVVVGSSWITDSDLEVPMMWTEKGGMTALPVPQVNGGQALGINPAGDIVGYFIDTEIVEPFLFSRGVTHQLPTLGGLGSKAYALNSRGWIVGYALTPEEISPKFHAVLWRQGVIHDLGAMAGGHGTAYGVNDRGTIVGFSYDAELNQIAVQYSEQGNIDLNTLLPAGTGWHLSAATGVAENGVISGIGTHDGLTRAFELVPDGVNVRRAPAAPRLAAASPQPAHAAGTIELQLDRAMSGPLRLYDLTGRRIADVASGPFAAGRVTIALPQAVLARLRPGVYFARIEGAAAALTQRVVVLR